MLQIKDMGRLAQKPLFCSADYALAAASVFGVESLNFGRFAAPWGCYSPADADEAQERFNANCGPAAFGAVLRSPITQVMPHFPHFPMRDWTTIGDMRKALQAACAEFGNAGTLLPTYGLALLQLRVNDRPLHPLFSLGQTHWVGVCNGCFYDVNWRGWLPIPLWEKLVMPQFHFGTHQVRRWEVRNSIEVLDQALIHAALGQTETVPKNGAISVCR